VRAVSESAVIYGGAENGLRTPGRRPLTSRRRRNAYRPIR
jgi:hypothetical protein